MSDTFRLATVSSVISGAGAFSRIAARAGHLPLSRSGSVPAAGLSSFAVAGLLGLAAYTAVLSGWAPTDRLVPVMAAIFVAALVSSIAGFAFSAICGAILLHLIDEPVRAVQIMMICSAGGQAYMVWSLRRQIEWRVLPTFLVGAAAGLPLGLLLLLQSSTRLYGEIMGALLVGYAIFMIVRRAIVVRRQHALLDVAAGFLGGITGGAAAFPGAPVTIWCGFKSWSKEQQRGLYQPFILIVQLAAIALLSLGIPGVRDQAAFDLSGVTYLPAMLTGSMLGMNLFKRLNDRQFGIAINVMLIVSGLSLLA